MWTVSATEQTKVSSAEVWQIYCDFSNWSKWDYGLSFYRPEGPFAAGTTGVLQPAGGPELAFELLQVVEGQCFVDRTPIGPDHAIVGRHELTPLSSGTQITHIIEIEGPNSEQMAQEMGFCQEELYETVSNLARYADKLAVAGKE
ncbi:SRPBCC family protein [Paenibacillus kobensis]|uniref:SRPBCC family protein n=1 Tax=Paenibacillus kobensis TaxID=59841 RepID=UPI000FD70A7B|nr:SRPBCC family protein [Paenibacillus kobensis]